MFENIDPERFLDLYNYFQSLDEESQRRKLGAEHDELIEALIKFEYGVGDIYEIIDE